MDIELIRSVCHVSLRDTWSAVRRACAKGAVELARENADALCCGWTAELVAVCISKESWRYAEGLCEALRWVMGPWCSASTMRSATVTLAKIGCLQSSSEVRLTATKALEAAARHGFTVVAQGALVEAIEAELEEQHDDDEERAARLAGATSALEAIAGEQLRLHPSHSAIHRLLRHPASTVRLAAAGVVQRMPMAVQVLEEENGSWQEAEARLVALDGMVSSILENSLLAKHLCSQGHDSIILRVAARQCERYWSEATCFEIQRAVRQLCVSVGCAAAARCDEAIFWPIEHNVQLFYMSAGCAFARYCAEHLGDCPRRWGAVHSGVDSPAVERRKEAVAAASPTRLRGLVDYFRYNTAINATAAYARQLLNSDDFVMGSLRLVAMAASAPHQVPKAQISEGLKGELRSVLRNCGWPTSHVLTRPKIDKLFPEVCAITSSRADDALTNALALAKIFRDAPSTSTAEAIAVCVRAALQRSIVASRLAKDIADHPFQPKFTQCLEDALPDDSPVVAVSCASGTPNEFLRSRANAANLAQIIAFTLEHTQLQYEATHHLVLALVFTSAFAYTSLTFLGASPPDPILEDITSLSVAALVKWLQTNCSDSSGASHSPSTWDDWDDDDQNARTHVEHQHATVAWMKSVLEALQTDLYPKLSSPYDLDTPQVLLPSPPGPMRSYPISF